MAKTTWRIKGTLQLKPQLAEMREKYGDVTPLPGVPIKVSAREKIGFAWGPWNKWGETVTKADGGFVIKKDKDKSARQFKVEVQFKDSELKLYPENDGVIATMVEKLTGWNPVHDYAEDALEQLLEQTTRLAYDVKWYTVHKTDDGKKHGAGTVDLGTMTFRANGAQDLRLRVARCHAEIWLLVKEVFKFMRGLGDRDLGFFKDAKAIAIKYPHSNPLIGDRIESSYANPENYVAHIIKNSRTDDFDVGTLLHELFHLYVYQRTTREKGLAWQLIIHGSTHDGRQKKTWVPAHEACAEWGSNFIYDCLFNQKGSIYGGEVANLLPFSRAYLRDEVGAKSLPAVEHYEDGWLSFFNTLVAKGLQAYDLNKGDPYVTALVGEKTGLAAGKLKPEFARVLKVFLPDTRSGTKYGGWLKRSELTFRGFLERMVAVCDDFTDTDRIKVLGVLDPAEHLQYDDLGMARPTPPGSPKAPTRPRVEASARTSGRRRTVASGGRRKAAASGATAKTAATPRRTVKKRPGRRRRQG